MSRKPAAPKPEELIAKLDEKFESFKEEITKSLEDRTADIEKANQNDVEVRDLIDNYREEDKKELDSVKNTLEKLVERKLEDVQRYQLHSTVGILPQIFFVIRIFSEYFQRVEPLCGGADGKDLCGEQREQRHGGEDPGAGGQGGERPGEDVRLRGEQEEQPPLLRGQGGQEGDPRRAAQQGHLWGLAMGCFYLHRFTAQIRAILRDNLSLKRDIAVSCASRMFSGPDVGGFRWSKDSLNK